MKKIIITKFPDRKKKSLCVYDTEENIYYVVGSINHNEDLLIEALAELLQAKED